MNIRKSIKAAGAVLSASVCLSGVVAAMPAYAAETVASADPSRTESSGTITVDRPAEGHTYNVYQIFSGSTDSGGTILGNAVYGANYGTAGEPVPEDELAALTDAKEFAVRITTGGMLHGDPAAVLSADSPSAVLGQGYYLITDNGAGTGYGDSVSDFIVRLAGDVTFSPKNTSVPSFDKCIDTVPEENTGTGQDMPEDDAGSGTEESPADNNIPGGDGASDNTTWDGYGPGEDAPAWESPGTDDTEHDGGRATDGMTDDGNSGSPGVAGTADNSATPDGSRTPEHGAPANADGHVHEYKTTRTEPSCTEKGSETHACECGDTYTEDVEPLGHDWETLQAGPATVAYGEVSPNLLTPGSYSPGVKTQADLQDIFGFGSGDSCENSFTVSIPYDGILNIYVYDYKSNLPKDNTGLVIDGENMEGHKKTYRLTAGTEQEIIFSIKAEDNVSGVSWAFESIPAGTCTRCGLKEGFENKDEKKSSFLSKLFPTGSASELEYTDTTETGDGTEEGGVTEGIEVMNTDTTVKYGVGDSVPFKLTATMPDSISAYGEYKLVFHDTLSEGLDYDEGSLKVFAGDTEIDPSAYTLTFNGRSFSVEITDAKAEPFNAAAGTEISVKYSATINGDAEFRNTNDAYLEYSNDPNGETTGMTVGDTITAFTFTVSFDKVDGRTGDPLEGAGFTLYKKDADGEYTAVGAELTGTTSFNFSGLAAGDYKLVETTTPGGYNTMEDLEFTIVAESTEDADGNAHVTSLKIISQGGAVSDGNISGWVDAADTGVLSADVANFRGSELPSTGGMGTTLFYIAGGCIMLVAGILIVKNKHIYDAQ